MKLKKSALMQNAVDFNYDNKVRGTVATIGKELSIQAIISDLPNKGYCHEAIEELKELAKKLGLTLVSGTTVTAPWLHICKKNNIKIYS